MGFTLRRSPLLLLSHAPSTSIVMRSLRAVKLRRAPLATLFPYTTLFRSGSLIGIGGVAGINPTGIRLTFPAPYRRGAVWLVGKQPRSEEHTSELQSLRHLVCRFMLEKNKAIHCPSGCIYPIDRIVDGVYTTS